MTPIRAALTLAAALAASVGSANAVNVWMPIGPPGPHALTFAGGEHVVGLAVDPRSPGTVLAGTELGIVRSIDGGGAWTLDGPGVVAFRIVVATSGSPRIHAGTNDGVFRSDDGGATWSATSLTHAVRDLVIDPRTPATLYASSSLGVLATSDAGATWGGRNLGLSDPGLAGPLAIDPVTPGTLYVALSPVGIFKSTNGAASWEASGLPGPTVTAIAIDPHTPATVYAGDVGGILFKTTNAGLDWDQVATLGGEIRALIAVPDASSTLFVVAGGDVMRSTNGGADWEPREAGLPGSIASLAIDPNDPSVLYAGRDDYGGSGDRGAFKSTDGGATWSPLGVPRTTASVLAVDPAPPTMIHAITDQGLFSSDDGGGAWTQRDLSFDPTVQIYRATALAVGPSVLYAGIEGCAQYPNVQFCSGRGQMIASQDRGGHWNGLGLVVGTNPIGYVGAGVLAIAVDPATPSRLHAGITSYAARTQSDAGVRTSTDGGVSWPVSPTFPDLALHGNVRALAIDPVAPATIYAATPTGVFRSDDAAVSWRASLETGLPSAIVVDPSEPARVYTAAGATVFKSEDGGTTWAAADAGLDGVGIVNGLAIDPSTPAILYAATDGGVLSTRSHAARWSPTGLGAKSLAIVVDPAHPATVYAGTEHQGIFRLDVAACATTAECDDGDGCTTDRCDPDDAFGDFRGCVHDTRDFPGVVCALRAADDSPLCGGEPLGGLSDVLAGRLERAARLVASAAKRPARTNAFLRSARRSLAVVSRRARRAARASGLSTPCRDELVALVRGFEDMLRALRR